MPRHFLPQTQLEEWLFAEKADLKDGKLVVTDDKGTFPATPAVHFTKLVTGNDDQKLVAKVKTEAQLQKLQAEHMADSVIMGDTAYEVVPGYVVDAPSRAGKKNTEADLLADFLLNKL